MKKREQLATIQTYYPNATTTTDGVNTLIDLLENTLNLELPQVMLADSICSDDINTIQYPTKGHEFLGPFKLGGLDGFPFTGLTGMGAFASHVPDEGAVVIYYGPHIGVSQDGVIGQIHRPGQVKNSGCCGAAKGALAKLINGTLVEKDIQDIDYQMNTIEQILLKQEDRVLKASVPLYEATEVIYEAIDDRMQELVAKTAFNCKYIILMGVILINTDREIGVSFHSVKRFEVINLDTKERQDFKQKFYA